jgi:hypothetical protein
MKQFTFGIIATLGALIIGNKIYNKGYDDSIIDSKKKSEKELPTVKKAK